MHNKNFLTSTKPLIATSSHLYLEIRNFIKENGGFIKKYGNNVIQIRSEYCFIMVSVMKKSEKKLDIFLIKLKVKNKINDIS